MKLAKLKKVVIAISITVLTSLSTSLVLGLVPKAEILVNEAREKKAEGDLEGAASRYYQALQIEHNNEIRGELASILIKAHAEDPYAEQTDIMRSLEENL